ncbi:MAG: ORF6N domain-containing protein [Ignavibacteria bacterium]|nr:ORF6N domain-containing protein [Ignavibacteria bacterium]
MKNEIVVYESSFIQRKIYTVRNLQVMFDNDLANFYGVETRRLNEQVKRNNSRFPKEFMFQLTAAEFENLMSQFAISSNSSLRSQNAILKKERGQHRKYIPFVFTEQGVAMLEGALGALFIVKILFG